MGIVAKQSIKGSVYLYSGALLGFVNTGLLMPKFFSTEQVGFISLLIAVSLIITNFSGLGMNSVFVRLFPYFRNEHQKHNGILGFSYIVTFVGVILSFIAFLIYRPALIQANIEKSELFAENLYYLPVLFILTSFYIITDVYNKSLFDATLGIFLREFFVRFLILILIISYIFNFIDFDQFVLYYVIIYVCPLIIITGILIKRNKFHITGINWQLIGSLKKEIFYIALFGLIAGFSGIAVMNIDKYMINSYMGLSSAGVYSISFYFGSLILLPSRALKKISSIVIAEAWKGKDHKLISTIYFKSTVNQLIIALFLFICIWVNIDNIFTILPDYSDGKFVILLIGGAYVIEMMSGLSDMIIVTSKHYRVFSYIMVFKIVAVIIFNLIFIPEWGLAGSAFASFLTILLSSLIRFLYVFSKFKFQPYNYKHFLIILFGGLTFLLAYFIPVFDNFYADSFFKTSVIFVLYGGIIFKGGFSEDLNRYIFKYFPFLSKRN